MMPAAVPVTLTAAERKTLKKRVRGAKTPYRDWLRAQIVLAAAPGPGKEGIAADLGGRVDTGGQAAAARVPGRGADAGVVPAADRRGEPGEAGAVPVLDLPPRPGLRGEGERGPGPLPGLLRSEEHTSELQSLRHL